MSSGQMQTSEGRSSTKVKNRCVVKFTFTSMDSQFLQYFLFIVHMQFSPNPLTLILPKLPLLQQRNIYLAHSRTSLLSCVSPSRYSHSDINFRIKGVLAETDRPSPICIKDGHRTPLAPITQVDECERQKPSSNENSSASSSNISGRKCWRETSVLGLVIWVDRSFH